jgi:hypothetical protein
MKKIALLLAGLLLLSGENVWGEQPIVPVSTFSIVGLQAQVTSAGLPDGTSKSLTRKLSNAQAAYLRGDRAAAIDKLTGFIDEVQSLAGKKIPSNLSAAFVSNANYIIRALQNGMHLGGTGVGADGATLQVTDPNSPAFGTKLIVPPGALLGPTPISMTVPNSKPTNTLISFPGSGIAFGPEGLEFRVPAKLVMPYPDANGDGTLVGTNLKAEFLKVGAQDLLGRISFVPPTLDTAAKTQTAEISHFSFYWNAGWY